MEGSVFALIRTKYNILSPTQKEVADYVLNHPQEVILFSLNELAAACRISETTVVRFLHKLGYDSYQVFRVRMAQELSGETSNVAYGEVSPEDSVDDIMNKVIQSTLRSISDSREMINPEAVEELTRLILGAGRIVVIGVGASAVIAQDSYHKLTKLGISAVCCSDPHLINIISGQLSKGELLLAFSHSGESREILDGVVFAREGGGSVAAITSYPRSTLARESDCVLLSSSLETRFRSDAMSSRIIQLVIIDILYVNLAVRMQEKAAHSIEKSRLAVAKNKT